MNMYIGVSSLGGDALHGLGAEEKSSFWSDAWQGIKQTFTPQEPETPADMMPGGRAPDWMTAEPPKSNTAIYVGVGAALLVGGYLFMKSRG